MLRFAVISGEPRPGRRVHSHHRDEYRRLLLRRCGGRTGRREVRKPGGTGLPSKGVPQVDTWPKPGQNQPATDC